MIHTIRWGMLGLVLLLGLGLPRGAQAQVSFTPATPVATGTGPNSIAIGDLDGDGKLDLAVVNGTAQTVSILLGDGSGGFAAATPVATGTGPNSIAIGDLDGDGKLDLAVVNGTAQTVSILLNTTTFSASGSFATAVNFTVGSDPSSVALGDVDRDGDLDLVVANSGSNNVSVFLGTGAGGFVAAAGSPFLTGGTTPSSVALGDVDRDGDLDLVVTNSTANTVSVLLGDGAGGFGAATNFATGANPTSVAIGDVDRDGDLDVVVTNGTPNTVSVLFGNGAGSFGAASTFATGTTPSSVALGDVDRDGVLDLVVANSSSNNVSVLLGTGTGSFGAATSFGTGIAPSSVAISDLNTDGKPDLSVTNDTSLTVSVLLNTAPGGTGGAAGQSDCVIATAAFGSPLAAEVETLRTFRARYLLPHTPGRLLVAAYARLSPPLAWLIRQHEALRATTRALLWPVVWWAHLALTWPVFAFPLGAGTLVAGGLLPYHLLRARRAPIRRRPRERGQ